MAKTTRRKILLSSLGIVGIGGTAAWFNKNSILRWMLRQIDNDGMRLSSAPAVGEDVCILTSSQPEGPFFIASPIRSDIREGRKGKELKLKIQLLRMPECKPIQGAVVEVWHCDAEGIYSGYPEDIPHDPWKTAMLIAPTQGAHVPPVNESRFLRGAQETDADGLVEFRTIFPGWYEPRAPHIHYKVMIGQQEELTSQFYFDPEFCNRLYRELEPYKAHGESPYTPRNDFLISQNLEAEGLQLQIEWNQQSPLEASAKVGIRSA